MTYALVFGEEDVVTISSFEVGGVELLGLG